MGGNASVNERDSCCENMHYFGENWDDREFPLGYLITIRTYGTWLHGDERTSVDTHDSFNIYGNSARPANKELEKRMSSNRSFPQMIFNTEQRSVVAAAIAEVCEYRDYNLRALDVRTNHAHAVVSAQAKPELIANSFKSYSTRALGMKGLVPSPGKVWARGRSRRYLWRENHLAGAIDYVLDCQGNVTFEQWFESKFT